MSWRLWGILFFFGALAATTACRDTVQPNEDRNFPPETYLTAAPVESIAGGRLVRIPYRYNVHWSGSDIDGEVAGFFVAVTETTLGSRLPPPKPQDYRFTLLTDSSIVFNVFEGFGTEREHGLYVYAVDNEGKVDPTPALVHFVARDRNLPGLNFTESRAEGITYVNVPGGGVMAVPFSRVLTDGTDPLQATTAERDTIPAGAAVYFGWQGFDRDWGGYVTGYGFKLFEPDFIRVDSTVKAVQYATGVGSATTPLPVGANVFRVRSIDEAGGSTLGDSIRRFIVNFDPDTWWFGPDTTDATVKAAMRSDDRGRYVLGTPTGGVPPELTRWLGGPAFDIMPVERKTAAGLSMRTFVERTRRGAETRYYIRVDGDTVARNADSLFFFSGGYDRDSPYRVPVPDGGIGPGRVGMPGPANGSPIQFDYRIVQEFVAGGATNPPFSRPRPNFNPLDALYLPQLHYDDAVSWTGIGYVQTRALDGNSIGTNSGRDRRIGNPRQFIVAYDNNSLPVEQRPLRDLLIRFYTNYKPYFTPNIAAFEPKPNQLYLDQNLVFRLYMVDPDSTSGFSRAEFQVRCRVRSPGDNPGPNEGYQPQIPLPVKSGDNFPFNVPPTTPTGFNEFELELRDLPVSGNTLDARTIIYKVPFYWQVGP